jgi:hypothetical protein
MNLMCPARLVLLPLGGATWGDQLTGERVAVVYAEAEVPGAGELAERLGATLAPLRPRSETCRRSPTCIAARPS